MTPRLRKNYVEPGKGPLQKGDSSLYDGPLFRFHVAFGLRPMSAHEPRVRDLLPSSRMKQLFQSGGLVLARSWSKES